MSILHFERKRIMSGISKRILSAVLAALMCAAVLTLIPANAITPMWAKGPDNIFNSNLYDANLEPDKAVPITFGQKIQSYASQNNAYFFKFTINTMCDVDLVEDRSGDCADLWTASIVVYDERGKRVISTSQDHEGVSMLNMTPGTYYIYLGQYNVRSYNIFTLYLEGQQEDPSQTPVNPEDMYVGKVINHVKGTDIKAYINGAPITSFNINGNTAVIAEDLAKYGFRVRWNARTRELEITKGSGFNPPADVVTYEDKVGRIIYDVLYSDIVTMVRGKKVESFNINGQTAIYIDSLAVYGNIVWDQDSRTIQFTKK